MDKQRLMLARDALVDSLAQWGASNSEGLYGSAISSRLSPSYTVSGVVLQAFNESRRTYLSHKLADALLKKYEAMPCGVFPREHSGGDAHVMCNSWPAFAILDAYPLKAERLSPICRWFLKNQRREDGSWSLQPNEDTHESIVTGYAVSALLQFLICFTHILESGDSSKDMKELASEVEQAIERGISCLLNNRSPENRRMNLYLWPAHLGDPGGSISLGTSSLCMHVISRWARYRKRSDHIDGVAFTLRRVIDAMAKTGDLVEIMMEGRRLYVWDQIHSTKGSTNYLWAHFAPITAVTALRFTDHSLFNGDDALFIFANKLVTWIADNTHRLEDGTSGVRGGITIPEVNVWATAQAVIVLSRAICSAEFANWVEIQEWKGIPMSDSTRKSRTAKHDGYIFIGHGGSSDWREVKDFIQDRLHLRWDEYSREPTAGTSVKERIEKMLEGSCFALLVLSAEDERSDGRLTARANVIHELGLFQGRLGFERAIVLLEEGCEEFSNIVGLNQIRFSSGNVKSTFEDIRRVLEREGVVR